MPKYSPSPWLYDNSDDVLGSPVLCTALLTLFFSSRSAPASPWLGCNKTSVGQVHHCTAGGLTNYSGTELFKILGGYK